MGQTAKIRIMADADAGAEVARHLATLPGWRIVSCSDGYPCRDSASRMRWYVELERDPSGSRPAQAVTVEPAVPVPPALPGMSPDLVDLLETLRSL